MIKPTKGGGAKRPLDSQPELLTVRRAIAARVRAVQSTLMLTNAAMASSLGVKDRTWTNWMRGRVAIDGAAILKLMVIHDVESEFLNHGTGAMFRRDPGAVGRPRAG